MEVIHINWESVKSDAQSIRADGKELNQVLSDAYEAFKGLSSTWKGGSYNLVAKNFNDNIQLFEAFIQIAASVIPETMEAEFNGYVEVDQNSTGQISIQHYTLQNLVNIQETETTAFDYDHSAAEAVRKQVEEDFDQSKQLVNDVSSIMQGTDWKGQGATANKQAVEEAKDKIVKALDTILQSFSENMETHKTNATNIEDEASRAMKSNLGQ